MRRLLIVALVVAGFWHYYAAKRVTVPAALDWASKNPTEFAAPTVYYLIGWTYYMQSNFPKAQQILSAFLADFPPGPHTERALLYLSDAAQSNRDYDTAKQSLDQLMKDYPNSDDFNVANQRRQFLNSH